MTKTAQLLEGDVLAKRVLRGSLATCVAACTACLLTAEVALLFTPDSCCFGCSLENLPRLEHLAWKGTALFGIGSLLAGVALRKLSKKNSEPK